MGLSVKFIIEIVLLCLGLALLILYFITNYKTIVSAFFEYLGIYFPGG